MLPRKHARTHQPGGSDPVGGIPWINLNMDLNGETATNGVDYTPPFDGQWVSPLNLDGTIDPTVFSVDGASPWTSVNILAAGLYLVQFELGWFQDWGAATVYVNDAHTDGETSLLRFGGTIYSGAQTYQGDYAPAAVQWALKHSEIWAIDERATDVTCTPVLSNTSGSNRTWNNTDRIGGASLTIFRLSPSGHSNPDKNAA